MDAAGLVPDTGALLESDCHHETVASEASSPPAVTVAESYPETSCRDGSTPHSADSELFIEDGKLVLRDEQPDFDNKYQVEFDAKSFRLTDVQGYTIGSSLAGVTGSGTSVIVVPWSSVQGVSNWSVEFAGGDDVVAFDLSSHGEEILSRFSRVQIVESDDPADASTLAVRGSYDESVLLSAAVTPSGQANLRVDRAGLRTTFDFAPETLVELGHVRNADLGFFQATGAGQGSREIIQVDTTAAEAFGMRDALSVTLTNGSNTLATTRVFDVDQMAMHASGRSNVDAEFDILRADNEHSVNTMVSYTRTYTDGTSDEVRILGPTRLKRSFIASTKSFTISDELVSANIQLSTQLDTILKDGAVLAADYVWINSLNGGIVSAPLNDVKIRGAVTTLLTRTSIGSNDNPLKLDAETLFARVSGPGGIYVEEANSLHLTARIISGDVHVSAQGKLNIEDVFVSNSATEGTINLTSVTKDVIIDGRVEHRGHALSNPYEIEIDATHGRILDTSTNIGSAILGPRVRLRSQSGIGELALPLRLDVGALDVETTSLGGVYLKERDALTITANIADGAFELEVGEDLTIDRLISQRGADTNGIRLTVDQGDLVLRGPILAGLNAQERNADVEFEIPFGSIQTVIGGPSSLVTGHALRFKTGGSIGSNAMPLEILADQIWVDSQASVWLHTNADLSVGQSGAANGASVRGDFVIESTAGLQVLAPVIIRSDSGSVLFNTAHNLTVQSQIQTIDGDLFLRAADELRGTAFASLLTQSGDLQLIADGPTKQGRVVYDGSIQNDTGWTIIRFDGSGGLYRGSLVGGGGFQKEGPGTLTLTVGSQLDHTGSTRVLGGTLIVDASIVSTSLFEVLGDSLITGRGNIAAPVHSDSIDAILRSGPNFRLGDGSMDGFHWTGTILVSAGETLTLRDANLTQLGMLTQLAPGSVLATTHGVEIGPGEVLTGNGTVIGGVVVRNQGTIDPAPRINIIGTDGIGLALAPESLLDLSVAADGTTDRVTVAGQILIDRTVLRLNGLTIDSEPGQSFVFIENTGTEAIQGRFVDPQGNVLSEGSTYQVGNVELSATYLAGATGNSFALSVPQQEIFFIPILSNAAEQQRFTDDRSESQDQAAAITQFFVAPLVEAKQENSERTQTTTFTTTQDSSDSAASAQVATEAMETEVEFDFRLFFRVYDDALMREGQGKFDLDPEDIKNLPAVFERYPFVDGHYRVYMQEAGSREERLVLEIYVSEGRVVPSNYRQQSDDEGAGINRPRETSVSPETPSASPAATETETNNHDASIQDASAEPIAFSLSKVSRRLRQVRNNAPQVS